GIEYEAAGLAALRRTQEDIDLMQDRLDALDKSLEEGGYGSQDDYAFHRSILVATQNSFARSAASASRTIVRLTPVA
ncbi:FCD domain-containing protein, partial [Rhizobium ruizarguesonis]